MCEAQVEGSRIGISVAPNTTHASRSYYQSSYFQEEKRYSVQVICSAIATGEEVMVETAFEVDTSPPRLPTITLSKNSTCPADGNYILSAGFSAADNRSGIDKYLYGISSSTLGTADIVNLTETSDSRATIPRLNLSSKLAVYWVIEAVDKVGNIGPRAISQPIIVESRCAILPTCSDGIQNGDETDVDVGGSKCPPGGVNATCLVNVDCTSRNCVSGRCREADHCGNAIKDETETDIDCGGTRCQKCENDLECKAGNDCLSGYCDPSFQLCKSPSCTDTKKNGYESDVDCGGLRCSGCDAGKTCNANNDCESKVCANKVCQAPLCTDTVQNGNESDVDCGNNCQLCLDGKKCKSNDDCQSGSCQGGKCTVDRNKDTDGDGMPDTWEQQYGFDPNNPADAALDKDDDDLTNAEEFQRKTNPADPDTDSDGASDGVEVRKETDPLDPNSKPGGLWWIFILLFIILIGGIGFYLYQKKNKSKPQNVPPSPGMSRPMSRPMQRPMPGSPLAPAGIQQSGKPQVKADPSINVFNKRAEEKAKQREDMLKIFGDVKQQTETASESLPEEEKKKESLGYLTLDEAKARVGGIPQSAEKKKASVFETLASVGAKAGKNKSSAKAIERLSSLAKESSKKPAPDVKKPALITAKKKDKTLSKLDDAILKMGKSIPSKKADQKKGSVDKLSDKLETRTRKKPSSPMPDSRLSPLDRAIQELSASVKNKANTLPENAKTKDIVNMFQELSKESKLTSNVFKTLLSHLIKKGKLAKSDLSQLLFELEQEGVVSKEHISEVFFELGDHIAGPGVKKK
ncbi:TPA: hypothetical protein HA296_06765 [Candidatus Woesearchaeota archaeon]|nr:hypothetical protein [Candidatus Woesearchaeota archaeon]